MKMSGLSTIFTIIDKLDNGKTISIGITGLPSYENGYITKKNGSEEQQRKSSDMDKLRYIYLIQ
jgi:hypothetical protein